MAENKTRPTNSDVDAFLAAQPEARRQQCYVLVDMMQRITGAPPVMWGASIVGFGSYHYRYDSGREGDAMLAGFSPRAREFAIYLIGRIPEQDNLLSKLGRHRMGKACLYVKDLDIIDMGVLDDLVSQSVTDLKTRNLMAGR